MTNMKHIGKLFKISLPGKTADKIALAISELDNNGYIEFLLILPHKTKTHNKVIPIPHGILKTESVLDITNKQILNCSVINKEIGEVESSFLEKVLRKIISNYTACYYNSVHASGKKAEFIPGKSKIPYAGRIFDEKEIIELVNSSLDFWLTAGKYANKFEKKLADFLGVKYCSLTNSGSSANLLAFMALTSHKLGDKRIKKGDEILTVAAGFPTTITPVIQFGAVPVFVDVTLPYYNIDCTKLKEEFCKKHNLWLIEDNCDALGSKYLHNKKWKYTGTFGHIATSSFYPPHHITMGEGGAVYTNDPLLKLIVESLRDWGRDCWCTSGHDNTCSKRFKWQMGDLPYGYDHKYIYSHFGYNLKATDMQAAIGCIQLEKLPDFIKARQRNWKLLKEGLHDLSETFILPEPTPSSDPSWFGFMLTLKDNTSFTRDEIVKHLESNGIQTRMLFAGNIIKHPCFDEMRKNKTGYRIAGDLINTDKIMNNTFWIGVYPGLERNRIEFIIETIKKFRCID
ncbi:lipopolysaccharide biosynthesis protein RfbH [Candidatus Desantisbacteria bacterium]|nr:lipopolysaccharide biosynthesis protein RfbH [Candidatus Desantisbacteria bacterium]